MPRPVVAFIGLGIMGEPMARNLMRAGFPLRVYNRTLSKADTLVADGAERCATPRHAATGADVVVTIVTDTPDVEAVVFGVDGALAGARRGALLVDMSTIRPDRTREFAARTQEQGVAWLDAPVSGGDVGARNATLTIMVGGELADFERAKPLLDALGRRVTHVGPVGAGQAAKACNQILCTVNLLAVCESLELARAEGLDLEPVLHALSGGAGNSWSLEHLGPRIARGDTEPGFMINSLLKDLGIVAAEASAGELFLPATMLGEQLFRAARALGNGRRGTQAVHSVYRALRRGSGPE